jgi:four helix bundle suffix protein
MGIEYRISEIRIDVSITLIKIASYLLSRKIKKPEKDFLEEGCIREKMTKASINHKKQGHWGFMRL